MDNMTYKRIQRRFKKKFRKKISVTDIKEVWDDYLQEGIINKVLQGGLVRVDEYNSFEVVGSPIWEDNSFKKMLLRGKMMRRNGTLKTANLNPRRSDIKYKITHTHSLKPDLYFSPSVNFKTQVYNALCNTNTYFRINGN